MKKFLFFFLIVSIKHACAQIYADSETDGSNTVTDTGIYYGFHTATPLAIEFLDLKAEAHETNILLKWNMQKEESDGHYEIERSSDALSYRTLGTINSKGNLHNVTSYELNDANPLRGQSYYRLRRYDKFGNFKTLSLITVQFTPVDFSIFPNPANDLVNFQYSVGETDYPVIEIYTADGIKLKSYDLDPVLSSLCIKGHLKQGIYHYLYKVNGETKEKGKLLISE